MKKSGIFVLSLVLVLMSFTNPVIKITKSKSQIEHIPYEKAYGIGFEDMSRRKPDISKINKMIGFKPTIGIEEIVEQVVTYMKSI